MIKIDGQPAPGPAENGRDSVSEFPSAPAPAAEQLAQVERSGTTESPVPGSPQPQTAAGADELLAGAPLPTGEAPVVTEAGPTGPAGGGVSRYSSDFGDLIEGLTATSDIDGAAASDTPGSLLFAAGTASDGDARVVSVTQATAPAAPGDSETGDDTGTGGDDTGTGGEDTGSGGGDGDGVPAGPGADQPLFTNQADHINFNEIDAGGYSDGSQYDAEAGNDIVILPNNAAEALEAGFVPGTLFQAGNGNDEVTGGDLNDVIDGGNGEDLLWGGAGADTLFGGNGKDTLSGGAGDDVLSGGNGKDVFKYSLSADEGHDVILDFKSGNGGDSLAIGYLLDVNGDHVIDLADLDAGGHSVSGSADAIVITFASGTSITLDGLNGIGIDSFADLVADAKVNVDIM